MLMAMGNAEIYIMTRRVNCAPGLRFDRVNEAAPVCRAAADWKKAAATRWAGFKCVNSGLCRSSTRRIRVPRKLRPIMMPNNAHVVPPGNRSA